LREGAEHFPLVLLAFPLAIFWRLGGYWVDREDGKLRVKDVMTLMP